MRRINLVVPLLALSIVAAGVGRAEAARIDVNGLNGRGAIIWDDAGDVLTMSNLCGDLDDPGSLCETTDFTSRSPACCFPCYRTRPACWTCRRSRYSSF